MIKDLIEFLTATRIKCTAIECEKHMDGDTCKWKKIIIDKEGKCWHYSKYTG